MIKVRKLIKILVKTIVVIFLFAFFIVCILLGILHVKATQSIGAAKFEQELLEVAGCYSCRPYPPSKDWTECSRLKEAWKYLDNEKVQKILFCDSDYGDANLSPDNWGGWEIVDQEKINQTLELLRKAEKGNNESIIWMGKMKIITDKHKFIIPIHWNDKGIYGYEWTSAKLREKLNNWGFGKPKDSNITSTDQ